MVVLVPQGPFGPAFRLEGFRAELRPPEIEVDGKNTDFRLPPKIGRKLPFEARQTSMQEALL